MPRQPEDLTRQKFYEWIALEYTGNQYWKCMCSCGKIGYVKAGKLKGGYSRSCGHTRIHRQDLRGQEFGELTALEYVGNRSWRCICSCGKEVIVNTYALTSGHTKSCGHLYNRNIQVNTDEIKETYSNDLETKQVEQTKVELYKREIIECIKGIFSGNIEYNNDTLLNNDKLDIYIADKKLAIDINNNYLHSDTFKDKKYHQNKTISCAKLGIRLIHIFEYEWKDSKKQVKIKELLHKVLNNSGKVVYARKLRVDTVDNTTEKDFLNEYHLQGYSSSTIKYGLYNGDELVSLMTFARPRFNNSYDFEVVRLCCKDDINIIGGTEKMFKAFKNDYPNASVISYCDISKFTGNIYAKLGFRISNVSEPNYVWISSSNNDVLPRYKTQKHKLLKLFPQFDTSMTESDIMRSLGYFKVYDCGNLVCKYGNIK